MPEPEIVYTVKELLDKMRTEQTQGFSDILARLDGKADKADVAGLRSDLNSHRHETDRRLTALEDGEKEDQGKENYNQTNREHRRQNIQLTAATISSAAALVLAVVAIH